MKKWTAKSISFNISEAIGDTSALYIRPPKAEFLLVLAHGAGAGMVHPFMEMLAQELTHNKVATFRFNFAYMHQGKKVPDRPNKALPAIETALTQAKKLARGLPIFLGGKSFGGRMSSQLLANQEVTNVRGVIYFGFPLHAVGKPSKDRAAHLKEISQPQLFLQGTRDTLAQIDLIKEVSRSLRKAKLEIFEGADHSFKMLKSSGVSHEEVIQKLAQVATQWGKSKM